MRRPDSILDELYKLNRIIRKPATTWKGLIDKIIDKEIKFMKISGEKEGIVLRRYYIYLVKRFESYLLVISLIAVIALLVYQNSFGAGFQFDDFKAIVDNASIRDIKNLPLIFSSNGTRPILFLSFALNYHFGGASTWGYHLVNLLLHILNGVLVYLIIVVLSKTYSPNSLNRRANVVAIFPTVFFLVHPIQTEAVTYVISRSSVLCTTFYLLSLYLFIRTRENGKPALSINPGRTGNFIFSIIFFLLALFTKETAATLPIIIILYDYVFILRRKPENIKGMFRLGLNYIPFWIILLSLLILRYSTLGALGNTEFSRSMYSNILSGLHVMVGYLNLFFFPHNQSADPDFSASTSLREPEVIFSILIIAVIIIVALRLYKKIPLFSFGIFWYFIALLPTSSIISLQDVMAEHRAYLPSIGFFMSIGALIAKFSEDMAGKQYFRFYASRLIGALILVFMIFSVGTIKRNLVWIGNINLWKDATKKAPLKDRVHANLGLSYEQRGLLDEAIIEYNRCLKINPVNVEAIFDLGNTYHKKGWIDKAIEQYRKSISLDPKHTKSHFNLGIMLYKQDLNYEAIEEFEETLRLNPNYADAHSNLGVVYYNNLKDNKRALFHFRRALKLNPNVEQAASIVQIISLLEKSGN
ncbi:MAG: tetratricopeptide repeat protein [Deltaproteobacteria bacterium]|nr:MAG: tetratricopeptide repeat protein [Deltaproteobacteria bacterium]